jgi:hypothetical protein
MITRLLSSADGSCVVVIISAVAPVFRRIIMSSDRVVRDIVGRSVQHRRLELMLID